MHYTESKTILNGNNGMNLYRGCTHGCIYCDSRSKCYGMDHDFEDVEVKSNAVELLDAELRKKHRRCMISTGSMTDPYIPLEEELCHVRRSMELAEKKGFGYTLITKSDLVLRDADILSSINSKAKAVVQMTVTTYDDELCRVIEPNVCPSSRRFEVLKELHDRGIPTVVWLCPILPFINDTEENIGDIVDACHRAGVYGIVCFGMSVTLREGSREYFYGKLDEHFPGTKEKYIRTFGNRHSVVSPRNNYLMRLFGRLCDSYGIVHDNDVLFAYLSEMNEKPQKQTAILDFLGS